MNIPIQIGWPQLILLLIGLVGLWLFITAGLGLLNPHRHLSEEEKEYYTRTGNAPRRRFKLWRGLSGILLLAVAVSLLWVTFLVQSYLGLTGEIKVAHIRATQMANVPHQMSVEVMLYDQNGHVTSDNTYLIQGDEWMVQGDIIKFPAWLNVIGLHAGYKLTRLEGRYDDINLENTARHTAVPLNGGDDNFFRTTYVHKQWFAPFVDAAYGNAVFQAPGSFDVFATQDALIARPNR
jgi:hypothetical protein